MRRLGALVLTGVLLASCGTSTSPELSHFTYAVQTTEGECILVEANYVRILSVKELGGGHQSGHLMFTREGKPVAGFPEHSWQWFTRDTTCNVMERTNNNEPN